MSYNGKKSINQVCVDVKCVFKQNLNSINTICISEYFKYISKPVKLVDIDDVKETFKKYDNYYSNLHLRYFEIYERTGNKSFYNWAFRTEQCGSYLEFALFERAGLKLINANFCGDRLCLMCNWRRSLRTYSKIARIIDYLSTSQSEKKYRFLFLTLTLKNCEPSELQDTINQVFYGFNKFTKNKTIKTVIKGYFRSLEITVNDKTKTFHPHLHLILAVPTSYFSGTSGLYLSHSDWQEIWQSSAGLDYSPVVNIKAFKNQDNKGVLEACKYSVKLDDEELKKISSQNLEILRLSMINRRLIGIGGIFRTVANELKIDINDDEITKDYLNDDEIKSDTLLAILRFFHSSDKTRGYRGFVIKEIEPVNI